MFFKLLEQCGILQKHLIFGGIFLIKQKLKIFTLFLAFVLIFCSCDSKADTSDAPKDEAYNIGGVLLSDYSIVYDTDNVFSLYAAEIMRDYLRDYYGITINVLPDSSPVKQYELLVGETNRFTPQNDLNGYEEYNLFALEDKIVLLGDDFWIGGAVYGFTEAMKNGKAIAISTDQNPITYTFSDPTNAILMIGDGMGFNHTRLCDDFYAEKLPNKGECITASYSVLSGSAGYTDSAAAATAISTGYKTVNGYVGLDSAGNYVKNIRELAAQNGAATAVLTTDSITGATPAAFLAHCFDRYGDDLDVQVNDVISGDSIAYAYGNLGSSLTGNQKFVLSAISEKDKPFFIMTEEGYIDKHSHNNELEKTKECVNRFNDTVGYTMVFTLLHPGTVLIVTADHETGDLKLTNGKFSYHSEQHTNQNVPIYCLGKGTDALTQDICDNTDIAKFIAAIYGETNFGDENR